MSSKKSKNKGIIKPLAAAFLETDPDEEATPDLRTIPVAPPRQSYRQPEIRSISELTKEETRVMLREQLVSKLSTEAPVSEPALERLKKNAAQEKAAKKKTTKASAEPVKEEKPKPQKIAAKKEAPVSAPAEKAKPVTAPAAAEHADIFIEYQGKSYNRDEIVERAVSVWVRKLKRGKSNIESLKLYVKPQEQTVYYVFNKTRSGSFPL